MGSGMVPFERALVISYRPSIVTFHPSLRVSEIILPRFCAPACHSNVPLGVDGWTLGHPSTLRGTWGNLWQTRSGVGKSGALEHKKRQYL